MENWNGNLKLVNPTLVKIDHAYQRPEVAGLIYAIAGNFRWDAFGAPVCIERTDGTLYCADGQQRISAVKMMDDAPTEIPVLVFSGNGKLKTEAQVFTVMNEYRKGLTPIDMHRGKLVGEDPAALAIERAVEKAGFAINPGGKQPGDLQGVGTLNWIYNNIGEAGVSEVLFAFKEAWGDAYGSPDVQTLRLLTRLVIEQGESYDRNKLTDALSGTTPGEIKRKARELQFEMSGSLGQNMRRSVKALVKV